MTNSVIENNSSSKSISESFYRPNFVLVNANQNSDFKFIYKNTFGDLIPIYSSFFKLTNVIDTSVNNTWGYFQKSIDFISTLAIYIVSLSLEIINSTVYNTYLFIETSLEKLSSLPGVFIDVNNKLSELKSLLGNSKTRGFWWIGLKLDIKQKIFKLYRNIQLVLGVLNKFYLLALIAISFSGLIFASNSPKTFSNISFSSKIVSNYAKVDTVKYNISSTSGLTPLNILQQDSENQSNNLFTSVKEYVVQTGDTLDKIAEMNGVSVEAIAFNNQLKNDEVTLPQKLYIPFSDSYIYKATKDTKIDDLSRIYGVSKEAIYASNETTLNRETQSFSTGSLVIIPISNFNEVSQKNSQEESRISSEEKQQKQAQARKQAFTTVGANLYTNDKSDQRSVGLIFPTVWGGTSTSRCIQPGHIACDFANKSEPPIFAAQSGKIVTKGYEAGGYGNYVIIDHGNNIKTLYAHMRDVYVSLGQEVSQGQSVGQMGCVGACTGTHIHFEVIVNGVKQNPVNYLERIP